MRCSLNESLERRFRAPRVAVAHFCVHIFASVCFFACTSLFAFCTLIHSPTTALATFPENSEPAARILYTADTLGHIHPCQTCGDTPTGGLARRAALLKTYAATRSQPLILAGPNEFYSDGESPSPQTADSLAPALHAAFGSMPYAAVYLGPATVADWQQRSLPLHPNSLPVADQPVSRIFPAGRLTAACIFLPPGANADGSPSPDQILMAQLAAREARSKADLVIAVSPWGMQAENALTSSLGGYFHILLGGGNGIAIPGQASGELGFPGPLWIRSDRRGRAVNELAIHALPAPGTPWIEGVHFSSRLLFLDHSLPQDKTISKITAQSTGP